MAQVLELPQDSIDLVPEVGLRATEEQADT